MLMLGDWQIDQSTLEATKDNSDTTLPLSPQMVALLGCLAQNQHRLLSIEELSTSCNMDADAITASVKQLCELFKSPIIKSYDNHLLLEIEAFHYTYTPVTLDDVRADALKAMEQQKPKTRCVRVSAAQKVSEPEKTTSKTSLALKGLVMLVVVALVAFMVNQ